MRVSVHVCKVARIMDYNVYNVPIPLHKTIPYWSLLGWGLRWHFSGSRTQVSGTVGRPLDLWRV